MMDRIKKIGMTRDGNYKKRRRLFVNWKDSCELGVCPNQSICSSISSLACHHIVSSPLCYVEHVLESSDLQCLHGG